jgi:WD40 repeat protein
MRPLGVNTIWTALPNPYCTESNENVAVGTSNGLITLENASGTWRCSPLIETNSDVLALDWLSPTILAAGLRDASVMLYDSRSRDSIKRLRHGAPIIGLRRADHESRLVVCGITNCLAMYDLRMIREAIPANTVSRNSNHHRKQNSRWKTPVGGLAVAPSKPVLRFEYANQGQFPIGFDVQTELGLVAAAEETGDVQLYSMRTGEKVRKLEVASGGVTGEHVKCLRFVKDERGVAKLMAGAGARIVEYCW